MNSCMPALFVSHGAPSILTEPGSTRDFLAALGGSLPQPRAILCISAHWTTSTPMVTHAPHPATIHDFGGFPDELYRMTYPAPGDPSLARRVTMLLEKQGIEAGADVDRGLDHGAWIPLKLMFPEATVPVIQLSVQPTLGPAHHLAMGAALRPLREEGVLILASGSATHNLGDAFGRPLDAAVPAYVREFGTWLKGAVVDDDRRALLEYVRQGPHAVANHPTPEHLLPLFVPLGAGEKGHVLHEAHTYGVISMAAFGWE